MKYVDISQDAFEELESALSPIDRFTQNGEPHNNLVVQSIMGDRLCVRVRAESGSNYGFDDYQRDIRHTYKPGRAANHALGVAGELSEAAELLQQSNGTLAPVDAYQFVHAARVAGRICDTVKKAEYHKRAIDLPALKKELGDVLWYVTALAIDYGFTLSDVARTNMAKLKARYPEGFVQGGGIRDAHPLTSDEARKVNLVKGLMDRAVQADHANLDKVMDQLEEIPSVLCGHANECPRTCPCPPNCACRRLGSAPSCKGNR